MATLETRVREALINQTAEGFFEFASKDKKYRSLAKKLAGRAVEYTMGKLYSEVLDKKEVAEMKQEVISDIQRKLDDPRILRAEMYNHAKRRFMSVKQLRDELKTHFDEAKEVGISRDAIDNYKKAYSSLFGFVTKNDEMVERLTCIAKRVGVDRAVTKDARYAVLREMFPTPRDYREFENKGAEVVKNFFKQAQNALAEESLGGKVLGDLVGALGKVFEESQDATRKIHNQYLEKTIKEIYGK